MQFDVIVSSYEHKYIQIIKSK